MHKYVVGITSGVLVAGLTGYILMDTFVISKEQKEEIPLQETTAYQTKTEEKQATVQPQEQKEEEETSSDTEKKDTEYTEEDFEPKTYNSEFGKDLKKDKDSDTDTETDEDDYAYGYGNGDSQSDRNESDSQRNNWFDNYFENYKRDYSNDEFSADWEEWFQKEFGNSPEGWSFFSEPDNYRKY